MSLLPLLAKTAGKLFLQVFHIAKLGLQFLPTALTAVPATLAICHSWAALCIMAAFIRQGLGTQHTTSPRGQGGEKHSLVLPSGRRAFMSTRSSSEEANK